MSKSFETFRAGCIAAGLVLATSGGARAQDTLVAGWDFSQYIGPNALTVDCINPALQLEANYSDFDPTAGTGAEASAFGTMFNDGSNGSTDSVGAMFPYNPASRAVTENKTRPQNNVPFGDLTPMAQTFRRQVLALFLERGLIERELRRPWAECAVFARR